MQGTGSNTESPAAETSRERLLAAAVSLFAERGFERASMRDLAARTGMSLAGLYHHFASKDQLLYALQLDAFGRLFASLDGMPSEAPPAARLEFLIRNHLCARNDQSNIRRQQQLLLQPAPLCFTQ